MNAPTDINAELARRTNQVETGAWNRRADGKYVAQTGWDANEVVGKDGLATKQNGEIALWLNGEPAWHKLGAVANGWTSVDDALDMAGLNWKVEKRPLFWGSMPESVMGIDRVRVGQQYATVRVDDDGAQTQLGTVGELYVPFQNAEAFSFLQEISEQDGSKFSSAGLLSQGSVVFVSMELGEDLIIDPQGAADRVKRWLLFTNRHDGKGKLKVFNTPVRAVCTNTVTWGIQGALSSWDAIHTPSAAGQVNQARRSLNLANAYYEGFEKDATALFQTPMTDGEFDKFIESVVYPLADDATDRTKTAVQKERDTARDLFSFALTNENIRGTRWAAAQALVEQIDFHGNTKVPKSLRISEETPKTLQAELARGARTVQGLDEKRKTEIHKALLTWGK